MNSLELSSKLGIEHRALLYILYKYQNGMEHFGELVKNKLIPTAGRPVVSYDLNKSQVLLLILHSKTIVFNIMITENISDIILSDIIKHVSNSTFKRKQGYLYCVSTPIGTKIGRSINPEKRIKCIITQSGLNSDKVKTYISTSTEHYASLEVTLFRSIKEKRLNGEWFDIGFNDAKFKIQSSVCVSNHRHTNGCVDGCFICDENYIAFDICTHENPTDNWVSEMITAGLNKQQATRWNTIYLDLIHGIN